MKIAYLLPVAGILMIPAVAHAYIDPGSGMLVWQGFLALIGAILVFLRSPIQVIKEWLKRILGK